MFKRKSGISAGGRREEYFINRYVFEDGNDMINHPGRENTVFLKDVWDKLKSIVVVVKIK